MYHTLSIDPGTVCLVGAGPGDPGLITVRGLAYLESADVVVYDRLVDERLMNRTSSEAELINPSNDGDGGFDRQEQINDLLIDRARSGNRVVRLKGGDPFIFGRVGEEVDALVQAGIPFEVVPGVTSAIAAPAYAGIPLTYRDVSASVTIVTGAESPDKISGRIVWEDLARCGGTIVILMGLGALSRITKTLSDEGFPKDTPVAVVQWGSRPYQRTVVGTISNIGNLARKAGLTPPAVIVIGNVVRFRDRFRWFDNKPLFGKHILVTRTAGQAGILSELLSREGANPLELPTLDIRSLDNYDSLDSKLRLLNKYDWIVFTSSNAVDVLFSRIHNLGWDSRHISRTKVAAIGPSTRASLLKHGIIPDLVSSGSDSESLADDLTKFGIVDKRIFVPGSQIRRDILSDTLRSAGADVDEVVSYRVGVPFESKSRFTGILRDGMDVITFTSSSAAKNLVGLLDGELDLLTESKIACIGPVTAEAVEQIGLRVDILPTESTVRGLVSAIKEYFEEATLG